MKKQNKQEFVFDSWVFDVDAGLHVIRQTPRGTINLDVDQWAEALHLDSSYEPQEGEMGRVPVFVGYLDEMHAAQADISVPVLVATLLTDEGRESHLLIDGHHRLRGAVIRGARQIPAHVLTVDETRSIQSRVYRQRYS